MSISFKPNSLDLPAFAQACMHDGASLEGVSAHADLLTGMQRLAQDLCALEPGDALAQEVHVQWRAVAHLHERLGDQSQMWLRLAVHAALPLSCQRCLHPVIEHIDFERDFRFVADEQTAEQEDDDSEEDLLVLSPRFDLLALIEDELLMGLPIVAKHEACPVAPRLSVVDEAYERAQAQAKPHAFAVLGQLKKS